MTYRVMTVCTGNICRSPMAEIVLRARFDAAGLGDQVEVDSSGISDEEHGNPVDRRARAVLSRHGYPTGDGHHARQVSTADLPSRDLVLAMTSQHFRALSRLGGSPVMFRSFDPTADAPDVDDPWYGGPEDFERCLAEIEAAADGIVAHVQAALA